MPATAVFMPMTWPELSISGPPEFPGLMAASVWIMSVRVSVADEVSSPAVTVRPRAEMMPWVTVGVPAARPSALPMAMAPSPTTSLFELPKVMVGRPEAPLIWRSAASFDGSAPTRVAGWAFVVPDSVTVMVPPPSARATTWLLVITSPLGEMIIPVPWSSSPSFFTSIETTAGRTSSTSLGIDTFPLIVAAPGVAFPSRMVNVEVVPEPLVPAAQVTMAPTAPPINAATTATASQVQAEAARRAGPGAVASPEGAASGARGYPGPPGPGATRGVGAVSGAAASPTPPAGPAPADAGIGHGGVGDDGWVALGP